MRKLCSILLAATMMAAGIVLGLQGMASAAPESPASYALASEDVSIMGWPTGCSSEKNGNGWSARCTNANGGAYKATVLCQPYDGGPVVHRDAGVWRTSGPSAVYCPPLTYVLSGGIITRSYN